MPGGGSGTSGYHCPSPEAMPAGPVSEGPFVRCTQDRHGRGDQDGSPAAQNSSTRLSAPAGRRPCPSRSSWVGSRSGSLRARLGGWQGGPGSRRMILKTSSESNGWRLEDRTDRGVQIGRRPDRCRRSIFPNIDRRHVTGSLLAPSPTDWRHAFINGPLRMAGSASITHREAVSVSFRGRGPQNSLLRPDSARS